MKNEDMMSEQMSDALKWTMVTAGALLGTGISLMTTEAKSHKDACIRGVSILFFVIGIGPMVTRLVVRWTNASVESIPDMTIGVCTLLGAAGWMLIAGWVKYVSRTSDKVASEGMVALMPEWLLKAMFAQRGKSNDTP